MRKWVPNLVFKFDDDPTVNESGFLFLLWQFWLYVEKKELCAKAISLTKDIILQISTFKVWENKFHT